MISTVVGRYVGIISRKQDGSAVPFHKFTEVLVTRPIARDHVYAEAVIPVSDTQYFSKADIGQLLAVTGHLTENALDQLVMAQIIQVLPAERVNIDDDHTKQRMDTYHRLRTSPKQSPKS